MIGKKIFEEVSAKLSETIANSPAKDVEKNVKSMLGSAFNRMDLITREEFDIQQQVLIKTRTKLAELEARLAKLEFEERTAKLISKDEVDIKYFQLARQLRDRMQQIPRKVAPEIVALVVADPDVRGVTVILDVAIREALEDLAR